MPTSSQLKNLMKFAQGGVIDDGQEDTARKELIERAIRRLSQIPVADLRTLVKMLEAGEFDGGVEDAAKAKGPGEREEVAKLERNFESYAEEFAKNGTTKESLVAGFRAARKSNPSLTAAKFLPLP